MSERYQFTSRDKVLIAAEVLLLQKLATAPMTKPSQLKTVTKVIPALPGSRSAARIECQHHGYRSNPQICTFHRDHLLMGYPHWGVHTWSKTHQLSILRNNRSADMGKMNIVNVRCLHRMCSLDSFCARWFDEEERRNPGQEKLSSHAASSGFMEWRKD